MSGSKHHGLTEEEHDEMAELLAIVASVAMLVETSNAFGKTSKVARARQRLEWALSDYRNALDDHAGRVSHGRVSYFGRRPRVSSLVVRAHNLALAIFDRRARERRDVAED